MTVSIALVQPIVKWKSLHSEAYKKDAHLDAHRFVERRPSFAAF
jgi:hypothetical protein